MSDDLLSAPPWLTRVFAAHTCPANMASHQLPVIEIPPDRLGQSRVETVLRGPTEGLANLRGIDGITPVMARAVLHKGFQLIIPCDALSDQGGITGSGQQRLQERAQALQDLQVRALASAPDVVLFPDPPCCRTSRIPAQ